MQYTPKSREEVAASNLIPKGVFDCECIAAEEKQSKKGNDMLVLNLKVWLPDGSERHYTDYIVPSSEMGLAKLCTWADSAGIYDKYEAGTLSADDCVGKTCKVVMAHQKDKQTEEMRNNVREYKRAGDVGKASALEAPHEADAAAKDDIPW